MNLELHKKLASKARDLIEKNGREIFLIRSNINSPNENKPWRKNEQPHENTTKFSVICVFINPKSASDFGFSENLRDNSPVDKIRRKYLLLAEDTVLNSYENPIDLSKFDLIEDNSDIWKIVRYENLKPGNKSILHLFIIE